MKHSNLSFALAVVISLVLAGCADAPGFDSVFNGTPQPEANSTPVSEAPPTPKSPPPVPPQPQAQARPQQQVPPQVVRPQAQVQPQAQPQPNAAPMPNAIPQVAQRAGLTKCAPRIKQVTDFLTANTQHNGQMILAPDQRDQKMASVVLELQSGNQLVFADTGFDPGPGPGECGGFYETITYWDYNCEAVATRAYGSMKRAKPLRQAIMTLDGGPTLKIFLMPAANGCVAIKKEMVYK